MHTRNEAEPNDARVGASEPTGGGPAGEPRSESVRAEAGGLERFLRRAVEAGVKQLSPDVLRQAASELRLPKEVISQAFSQLDETKQGVYRAIGREVHDLLDRTNLSDELTKALSQLSLEIKMEVRFKPSNNDSPADDSSAKAQVKFKRTQSDTNKTEQG